MTYWQAGQRITGDRFARFTQGGVETITFTSQTSWTVAVVFPLAFGAAPIVSTNIAAAPGTSARWGSRGINVTATGFDLFLFIGDAGASATSWAAVPVQWMALAI